MLTEQNFQWDVEKIIINGKDCWKYVGDSLAECVDFARFVERNGESFYDPLTQKRTFPHRAILDKPMVKLLIALDHQHRYNDYELLEYPRDFPEVSSRAARGFSTNYNYLVQFGLLAKKNEDGVVKYWVTKLGRQFIYESESIRSELFNIGPEVVGYDEMSWKTFNQFFTEDELTEMRKPMWFVIESVRQEMLTPEELAIV